MFYEGLSKDCRIYWIFTTILHFIRKSHFCTKKSIWDLKWYLAGNTNTLFTATGSAFTTGTSGTSVQVTGSLYLKGDLTIENLGTLANRDSAGTLDFGDDFN